MSPSSTMCLALSAVALGPLACRHSTEPTFQPKSYQLVSYAGAPLPVTLRRIIESSTLPGGTTVTCDEKLTGATLELLDASRFTQSNSHLLVCDDGRADAASQEVLQGSYGTGADTLVLSADLGAGMSYIELARVTNGGLTIYRRRAVQTGGASSTDATLLEFRKAD